MTYVITPSIIARFRKKWEYRIGGIGAIKQNFSFPAKLVGNTPTDPVT